MLLFFFVFPTITFYYTLYMKPVNNDHLSITANFVSSVTEQPFSVAKLDARPTSDQKLAGSNPTGSTTFFRGD